jgi:hypothetical protein
MAVEFDPILGALRTKDVTDLSAYLPLTGGTLTGTLTSQTIAPSANATYNLGSSSDYYQYIYAVRHYLNSTAYLAGGVAGQITLNANSVVINGGPGTGTTTPLSVVPVNYTDTSANTNKAIGVVYAYAPPSDTSGRIWSLQFQTSSSGTANFTNGVGGITGFEGFAQHNGTGVMTLMQGCLVYAENSNNGNVTTMIGIREFGLTNTGTGTVGAMHGISISGNTNSGGGSVTNNYGIFMGDQNISGATNYAIFTGLGKVHFGDNTELASGKSLTLTAGNIATDTITGSKIGTGTTQKISFWNATPIIQPTTAIAASTFVANTSGIANDTATWDGYTIGQVIKALRNIGALA